MAYAISEACSCDQLFVRQLLSIGGILHHIRKDFQHFIALAVHPERALVNILLQIA
jgi:hypothetical protein